MPAGTQLIVFPATESQLSLRVGLSLNPFQDSPYKVSTLAQNFFLLARDYLDLRLPRLSGVIASLLPESGTISTI